MTPQPHVFHDGSGVCHRITFGNNPTNRYSVWVDANGEYRDAERIDRLERSYRVNDPVMQRELAHRANVCIENSKRNQSIQARIRSS